MKGTHSIKTLNNLFYFKQVAFGFTDLHKFSQAEENNLVMLCQLNYRYEDYFMKDNITTHMFRLEGFKITPGLYTTEHQLTPRHAVDTTVAKTGKAAEKAVVIDGEELDTLLCVHVSKILLYTFIIYP